MKRVYIAIALLCLCACICLLSFFTITKDCKQLIAQAKTIQELSRADNPKDLVKKADEIKQMWKHDTLPFSLLTTHTHYDSMEECVDKLYHACKNGDKKEITATSDDLIFEATHIITSIQPNAENVF